MLALFIQAGCIWLVSKGTISPEVFGEVTKAVIAAYIAGNVAQKAAEKFFNKGTKDEDTKTTAAS